MRKRLMGLTLALLYFSVSIFISGAHSHDHGQTLSHQCAACAWHSESNADAPIDPIFVQAPLLVVVHSSTPDLHVESSTPRICSDRGPPFQS